MTRAYYNIVSGPNGVERCPFCKPKFNKDSTHFRGTKLRPVSESGNLEFRGTEIAGLQGCLNQSSDLVIKTPPIKNSCRSFLREIRTVDRNSLAFRS